MYLKNEIFEKIKNSYTIAATLSSGHGGQNVNKRKTKAQLHLDISDTDFSEDEKKFLMSKLKNHINKEGILRVDADETRSFEPNKEMAIEKTINLIQEGLEQDEKRVATEVPESEKNKRIKEKKEHGEVKKRRGKVDFE